MPSMEGKQVEVAVELRFDPTKEDKEDAGAVPMKHRLRALFSYLLAAGANRVVCAELAATTGGLADDLSGLTALDVLIIENPKTNTYVVDTAYTSVNTTANVVRTAPGEISVVMDVNKAVALAHTAATATTNIKRFYVGY